MRIASLVPSATEMLFALGLGDRVVAVTHECDYPAAARNLPHLTRSVIPPGLSSSEIDAAVRERTKGGEALYELDEYLLAELQPDLVVTQAVCAVCAVSYDDVVEVAGRIRSQPRVLSLDPTTLGEVLADVRRLAEAADAAPAGEALLGDAVARLDRVQEAVGGVSPPRVLALEWLDPVFAGGHWVPAMVGLAGGEDAIGYEGEKSGTISWYDAAAAAPEVVVAMPCGYDTDGAAAAARAYREQIDRLGARAIYAVDAAAYFSRPGPRLVDGVELLAHLLHPELIPAPPPGRFVRL